MQAGGSSWLWTDRSARTLEGTTPAGAQHFSENPNAGGSVGRCRGVGGGGGDRPSPAQGPGCSLGSPVPGGRLLRNSHTLASHLSKEMLRTVEAWKPTLSRKERKVTRTH